MNDFVILLHSTMTSLTPITDNIMIFYTLFLLSINILGILSISGGKSILIINKRTHGNVTKQIQAP